MNSRQALIEWIAKAEGGRSKPPSGVGSPAYSTVVRFVGDGLPPRSGESWSLVVSKRHELGSEHRWLADIHYLFPDAPEECLADGRTFELLEGNKCVARGRILVEQDVASALAGGMNTQI